MKKQLQLPLLIVLVCCLNVVIYLRAALTIEEVDVVFAECARNSGRTSAAINLFLLILVGNYGLKQIFNNPFKFYLFRVLVTLFSINHLIHFFFVSQFFKDHLETVTMTQNFHGFITYLLLLLVPLFVWSTEKLSPWLYALVFINLVNVIYFISDTFYGRVKPEDQAYLHQIGIGIMFLAVLFLSYRAVRERFGFGK